MKESKKTVKINLFSSVTISYKDNEVLLSKKIGKKLINLFEYFVINKDRIITNHDIQESLLPENVDARDTIKYTIFRLRKALEEIKEIEELDLIETIEGGYRLSKNYKYDIDVFNFSNLYKEVVSSKTIDKNTLKTANKAMDLYKGRLYLSNNPPLVLSLQADELSANFSNMIVTISKYLLEEEKYEDVIELTKNAIKVEPFFEELHYYYIKGLLGLKKFHNAIEYYDDIKEKFVAKLGIGVSDNFAELYNDIKKETKDKSHNNRSIDEVKEEIEKSIRKKGGFYCPYNLFIYLYESTIKNAVRDDKKCFLVLFTIDKVKKISDVQKISNDLRDYIEESIRTSDIFSKVNDNQFVLLLCSRNIDNIYMIISRILPKFYKKYNSNKCRINYAVKEVENH